MSVLALAALAALSSGWTGPGAPCATAGTDGTAAARAPGGGRPAWAAERREGVRAPVRDADGSRAPHRDTGPGQVPDGRVPDGRLPAGAVTEGRARAPVSGPAEQGGGAAAGRSARGQEAGAVTAAGAGSGRPAGGWAAIKAQHAGGARGGPSVRGASGERARRAQRAADAAREAREARAARTATARHWRLASVPLAAPPPPAAEPRLRTPADLRVPGPQQGLPPVVTRIPTRDKVVFLTIDDGQDKDPDLIRMMADLKVPYTAFLTDDLISGDYRYFAAMREHGVVLDNHTLHHGYLRGMGRVRQQREICGMQDVLERRYGSRPELFRPPYGSYDRTTLEAAESCGIKAVLLWSEEAFADRMEYRGKGGVLHPGDIILTHFRGRREWRGTMPDMVRNLLRTVTAQGYAVARLEDYL
ncbi:hypothetical protein GCM10018793_29710 [Streptomyces sulfonofaciens]|uniref:NodB homology domain-containing protein n=1 Tax=Streptomyces sulfonofaciens TaxID=68272 RepID=A0A919KZ15_9ACTN|nr:polysaccharide deacetylase family protein [Streptomyces sulfonofaciens]GHH78655.1 hypothetical protein GCM10018793_29710 [Streptomyces sulfonofaciens]